MLENATETSAPPQRQARERERLWTDRGSKAAFATRARSAALRVDDGVRPVARLRRLGVAHAEGVARAREASRDGPHRHHRLCGVPTRGFAANLPLRPASTNRCARSAAYSPRSIQPALPAYPHTIPPPGYGVDNISGSLIVFIIVVFHYSCIQASASES